MIQETYYIKQIISQNC